MIMNNAPCKTSGGDKPKLVSVTASVPSGNTGCKLWYIKYYDPNYSVLKSVEIPDDGTTVTVENVPVCSLTWINKADGTTLCSYFSIDGVTSTWIYINNTSAPVMCINSLTDNVILEGQI